MQDELRMPAALGGAFLQSDEILEPLERPLVHMRGGKLDALDLERPADQPALLQLMW